MIDFHDAIAEFVDGERVDVERLKHALADPAAREYLIDLLALRELVAEQAPAVAAPAGRRIARGVPWLAAAAAVMLIGVLGGYAAGVRSISALPIPASQTKITQRPVETAPSPTHVIRLEPGVNWQERSGGH